MVSRSANSNSNRNTTPLVGRLSKAAMVGMCVLSFADAFVTNPLRRHHLPTVSPAAHTCTTQLSSTATPVGTAPMLKSLLKKPSKVLTVGVEYLPSATAVDNDQSLEVLSMKLRQQAKVSFILCSDLASIQQLSAEQETARGNFPGPLPIVCDCDGESDASWKDVADAGASAVVVDATNPESFSLAASASSEGLEILWKVASVDQTQQVLESTDQQADIFLLDVRVDDEAAPAIMEILPTSSMAMATLHEPMQEDGAELDTGKAFKAMGCVSVLVKDACVGDQEDIEYSAFCVSGLTSKASQEFKFSGLTGSTNGHFGGIQSNSSVQWERTAAAARRSDEATEAEEEDADGKDE